MRRELGLRAAPRDERAGPLENGGHVEWLREVIAGTGPHQRDSLVDIRERGEGEERRGATPGGLPEHVGTADVRQPDVADDEVRPDAPQAREGRLARLPPFHGETLELQSLLERPRP